MLYCNTVTVAPTRRAGAGLGTRALGRAFRRWAGAQAGSGRGQSVGGQARSRRWGAQQALSAQRAHAAGASRARRSGRAGSWARGVGRGARGVGPRRERAAWVCLCSQAGRAGWSVGPSWCTVHLAQFSTWFFDSVFFLSHQMNTVHCKINFGKKNYFKSN